MTEHGEIVPRPTVDLSLDSGRDRVRRRLAMTNPNAFNTPEDQRRYEDVLAQMLLEAEAVPGFGTMQDLAIEVYAFLWSRHQAVWNRQDDPQLGRSPVAFEDYEKLVGRLQGLFGQITKARTEAALEDTWKRDFINAVFHGVEDSLTGIVDDPEMRTAILQALLVRMRSVLRGE